MERDTRSYNLYACTKCDRFYVLFADPDDEQTCPNGHAAVLVDGDTSYFNKSYQVCVNAACGFVLKMDRMFPGDKCEGCNNSNTVFQISQIVDDVGVVEVDAVKKLAVVIEKEDHSAASGAARSLAAKLKDADEFKSSHHKNKAGRHTANESARHEKGDKANATIRQAKARALQEALDKLKDADGFDQRTYNDVVTRTQKKIDQLLGQKKK